MTRTDAKRQAHRESCIYRQGASWVFSAYDDSVGAKRTTDHLSLSDARTQLADWRRARVIELTTQLIEIGA